MPLETILIQLAIVACIVVYVVIYLRGIKQGRVKSVLATWIFLSFASVLSFVTNFFESGSQGVLVNRFNLFDAIATLIITSVIIFRKDIRKMFTGFEKICLAAVCVVFLGWLISRQNIPAHLCIQIILVIAYFPMLVNLWCANKNTESLSMWFLNFLASVFGLIEPLRTMSLLPLVYTTRSTVSTFIVMLFILRLKRKSTCCKMIET